MVALARLVVRHRIWVLAAWLVLTAAGVFAAPRATSALSYDFGLPGRAGYEVNQEIASRVGNGGTNPPVLIVIGDGSAALPPSAGDTITAAAREAAPGARIATYTQEPALLAADGRTGVVLVYPTPVPGPEPYAAALPALDAAMAGAGAATGTPVVVTGLVSLQSSEGGGGSVGVLAEVVFGGVGALVVLLLVFGSALALTPLIIAASSILTTFLIVWGITGVTEVSFIVQYLLALIGLGVAIDYALLVVTRWREERAATPDPALAIERAMATAGRSVLFSGVTVAVSLAALIALPVPFLRSVGFTGLLIPAVSVAAALTLLPALLATFGDRWLWPRRRAGRAAPASRLWERVGTFVVRRRWVAAIGATLVLLALALPVLGLRLGQPTAQSLASAGGPAATGVERLETSGLGVGLVRPVEILTGEPAAVDDAVAGIDGVAGRLAPAEWTTGDDSVVEVWVRADTASPQGSAAAAAVRDAATAAGGRVGGGPAEDADFLAAVYGNAPWVVAVIVVLTFLLLARALRSIWLPVKALVLNVLSLGAAYGVTVLIWQDGFGSELLFDQPASGAITIWVPIAVFAFLFGLSMDYEVFLLSRIREEHDLGHDTDAATVRGLARTGRLVTSAALILFFAFVSLSQVPAVDVKILATALALGIVIDATLVRGVLAPALVSLLGAANWTWPRWAHRLGGHAPAASTAPQPAVPPARSQ